MDQTRNAIPGRGARSAAPAETRVRRERQPSIFAQGEPMLWLTGGALVICVAMIVGLLLLVVAQGLTTFWPGPIVELKTGDRGWMGEVTTDEDYTPSEELLKAMAAPVQERARAALSAAGQLRRRQLRIGNFELTGEHYRWVPSYEVSSESTPEWAVLVERRAWGRFYGKIKGFLIEGRPVAQSPAEAWALFEQHHPAVQARWNERRGLETGAIGEINHELEASRLALKRVEMKDGAGSPGWQAAKAQADVITARLTAESERVRARINEINARNDGYRLVVETADGRDVPLPLGDVVRAFLPNRLTTGGKFGVFLSRWGEYLSAEPREANSEGGVFPAIFGTVVMTLLMSLAVVPLGVLAALYLREYAKAGPIISAVRIAVNNLAGVPSIVFGVFGLGFFCYTIGASIDQLFFSERLPSPTFGTGGIVWSALTLALLTLPVVIVATEEALAAVPRSMREGSYACGASKWQTIRRIVLPRAMPGIMTGLVLAMARGAGEVAPLMLVGAVKLAPDLPLDGFAPFVHLERSFMHLGFHIFDLGFQSQNSEAAKPMVYTTTLLLITIILALNLAAVTVRSRLRRKFHVGHF